MTPDLSAPDARRYARWALLLVAGTLIYNVIEAGLAIWAGTEAGSIALLGFGLDSLIEIAAAAVLLWRLLVEIRGKETNSIERAERRAHRFIGATFLALAIYVLIQSIITLSSGDRPQESLLGIVLAAGSLIIMPFVSWGKFRVAAKLGSGALRAEAKETLACAYLSFALLVGLLLNAILGWWWADPVVALVMVPWLTWEGIEGVRGEGENDR
jgi:divalent metal cation (Fe/Co/Zn/Cd) transporter